MVSVRCIAVGGDGRLLAQQITSAFAAVGGMHDCVNLERFGMEAVEEDSHIRSNLFVDVGNSCVPVFINTEKLERWCSATRPWVGTIHVNRVGPSEISDRRCLRI